MRAVLDLERLDRTAVERRLAATGDVELAAGWATFPEDGLTLATVVEAARTRLAPLPLPAVPAGDENARRARPVEQVAS
jgi:hypothetical protein